LPNAARVAYARIVDVVDLRDFVEFEEGGLVHRTVFESERLWAQVVCVDRNRSYGPVTDRGSDAVLTIVAGEAVFIVNRRRRRVKQWGSVLVPAGSDLVVTNASPEPLVVLMVAAPPPARPAG
jgi:mannose-6-phosphate isomerase-like protein (cupin superfamily)